MRKNLMIRMYVPYYVMLLPLMGWFVRKMCIRLILGVMFILSLKGIRKSCLLVLSMTSFKNVVCWQKKRRKKIEKRVVARGLWKRISFHLWWGSNILRILVINSQRKVYQNRAVLSWITTKIVKFNIPSDPNDLNPDQTVTKTTKPFPHILMK